MKHLSLSVSYTLESPSASQTPSPTKSSETAVEEMETGIPSDGWEYVCV